MTLSLLNQTVTIGGFSYRVTSCLLDYALSGVPAVSFDVDMDANQSRVVPSVGQAFTLTQVCDGTFTVHGQIASIQRIRLSGGGIRIRVSAYGEARKASLIRKLGIIQRSQVSVGVSNAWAGVGVDLSQLPGVSPTVPEFGMTYHSIAEYMEYVERQTGFVWSLFGNVLRVWDPRKAAGNPYPILDLTSADLEAGSIQYSETLDGADGIINVARQQAWFRREILAEAPVVFDARCVSSIPLPRGAPSETAGWEIENARVTRGTPLQGNRGEVQVRTGPDMIELDPPMDWNPQPAANITYRRLIWVEEKNEESIQIYGRREGPPLYHDGEMGVAAAHQNLKQYLAGVSLPLVSLTAIAQRADLYPGQIITLDVPEIGPKRSYVVRRVRRATSGTELEVRFDAETLGGFSASGSDAGGVSEPGLRVKSRTSTQETLRRIENLERGPINPKNLTGRLAASVGPIPSPSILGTAIKWSSSITAESVEPAPNFATVSTTITMGNLTEGLQTQDPVTEVIVNTSFTIRPDIAAALIPPNLALVSTRIDLSSAVAGQQPASALVNTQINVTPQALTKATTSALVSTTWTIEPSVEAEVIPLTEVTISTTWTVAPEVEAEPVEIVTGISLLEDYEVALNIGLPIIETD